MSYELLTHTTNINSLKEIKKSNELISKSKIATPYVYTYYVSNKIKVNPFIFELDENVIEDENIILLIRPEILRDEPFIVCNGRYYGIGCSINSIDEGEGNYKIQPNMNKLINHLNKKKTAEVVFNKIDLSYVVGIVGNSNLENKVKSIMSTIPFISVNQTNYKQKIVEIFQTFSSDKYKIDLIKKEPSTTLFELKKKSFKFAIKHFKNEIRMLDKTKDNKFIKTLKKDLENTEKMYKKSKELHKTKKNRNYKIFQTI